MKDCTSNNYLVPMVGRKQFLLSMESLATLKFHSSLFRYICFSIIYVESPALVCGELHMGTFPCPFTSFQRHYGFVEGSFGDASSNMTGDCKRYQEEYSHLIAVTVRTFHTSPRSSL